MITHKKSQRSTNINRETETDQNLGEVHHHHTRNLLQRRYQSSALDPIPTLPSHSFNPDRKHRSADIPNNTPSPHATVLPPTAKYSISPTTTLGITPLATGIRTATQLHRQQSNRSNKGSFSSHKNTNSHTPTPGIHEQNKTHLTENQPVQSPLSILHPEIASSLCSSKYRISAANTNITEVFAAILKTK